MASRVFRRTKTFVSNELWPILNPIVKHHKDLLGKGKILSGLERNLFETIELEGSIRTDLLRKKLQLGARENNSKFHRALVNLESYAIIVGAEDPHPEKHLHANIWQTWDKRINNGKDHANLSYSEAVAKFLEKTLDACVLAPEDDIGKWFEWSDDIQAAKEKLLVNETILKADDYLISSRTHNLNS